MKHVRQTATGIEQFFEFSLLGLLASGYLAVVGSGYLDTPTAALVALGLVTRGLIVAGWWQLNLAPGVVTALTVAYIGFYALDYFYVSRDFVTATVHLVFFLAIVKLVTAETERDYLYVKIIAFLELLAASVLSADANYSLFLALFLLFGVATFASGEILRSARRAATVVRSGQRRIGWRLAGLTATTMAGILILTAGLFIVLPRTARAAFQRLIPDRFHVPGFSGEVRLGEIGEFKMRSVAVMHARIFEPWKPVPLKWRGAALVRFDGKRWYNDADRSRRWSVDHGVLSLIPVQDRIRYPGPRLNYEVVMQEMTSDTLFFAGVPESVHINVPVVVETPSSAFRLPYTPDTLRYTAYCLPERGKHPFYRGETLDPAVRAQHLELPPLDPRIGELAAEVTRGETTDAAKAAQLERFLRERFSYSLELPQEEHDDPISDFLFRRRKGHCEYFASSLAVMLRTQGIPSRVVTGFQSGTFNPLSGWYVIRASDAHSWVEAWFPGQGWMTLEPTPPDPNPPGFSVVARMQLYFDAMQVLWQDWVLGYDFDRQLTLAARIEQSSRAIQFRWLERNLENFTRRWKRNVAVAREHGWKVAAAIAAAAAAFFVVPILWRRLKTMARVRRVRRGLVSASDATVLYQRMLEVLRQRGIEKPVWVTPAEFAAKLGQTESTALVAQFTAAYNELRFGMKKEAAVNLVNLLERLERG